MSGWLDVVFRPDRLSRELREGQRTPLTATHVLLSADVRAYLLYAREAEWPAIEAGASAAPGYQLPAALLQHLTSGVEPEVYEQIALDAERDAGERAVALALASALYAESWSLPRALHLLEQAAESAGFVGVTLAYLRTHVGLRAMEIGDWQRALDSSVAARKVLIEASSERAIRDALWEVNVMNEFWSKQLGFGQIEHRRASPRLHYRTRVTELTADALESDLQRSFDARFASRTHTIQIGGDSSEQELRGALLRSELLGEFGQIINARKNLGKYLLLSSAGIDARPSGVGFALLFRAREATGLGRAAAEYLRQGPIESVVEFGTQLVEVEWPPVVVETALKFVEQAADVLDSRRIDSLLVRLCDSYPSLIRPTAFHRAESDALSAITEVARVADPTAQSRAARFGLGLARSTSDGLTLQSLRALPDAIDWTRQPTAVVDEWVEFIQEALNEDVEKRTFAEAALFELLSLRTEQLLEILRRSRPNSMRLATAAVVAGVVERLDGDEVTAAAADLVSVLHRTRAAAAKGSYSMGAPYDAPALLGALLIERRDLRTNWHEVVNFICDPSVARTDKVGLVGVVADKFKRIPSDVLDVLRTRFGAISGYEGNEFLSSVGFESVRLRLGSLLGVLDGYQILQELLKLASNSAASRRQEAAMTAGFVRVKDHSAILAMLLLLSRDSDSLVRASATRGLLRREWSGTGHKGLVWARVSELLSEPGRTPTVGVVRGLLDGVTPKPEIPSSITGRVRVLAQEHPSWLVRTTAQKLVDRWKHERRRSRK